MTERNSHSLLTRKNLSFIYELEFINIIIIQSSFSLNSFQFAYGVKAGSNLWDTKQGLLLRRTVLLSVSELLYNPQGLSHLILQYFRQLERKFGIKYIARLKTINKLFAISKFKGLILRILYVYDQKKPKDIRTSDDLDRT